MGGERNHDVNCGILEGVAARDLYVHDNSDGSRTVFLRLHTDSPYSQYIDLQGYITPDRVKRGINPYKEIRKGEPLRVSYYVHASSYMKDEKKVYRQDLQIIRAEVLKGEMNDGERNV